MIDKIAYLWQIIVVSHNYLFYFHIIIVLSEDDDAISPFLNKNKLFVYSVWPIIVSLHIPSIKFQIFIEKSVDPEAIILSFIRLINVIISFCPNNINYDS